MFLNNNYYITLNYTSTLQHQNLWHRLLVCCFISIMQSVKGTWFLNIISLSFLSAAAAAAASVPCTITKVCLHQIYLLKSHKHVIT